MPLTLPAEVRWLVQECLPTMEHVELLLYLARHEGGTHSLREICDAISINPEVASTRMEDLVRCRLVATEPDDAGEARFAYHPTGIRERHAVSALADAYSSRPVTLIRFVYERPATSLQDLADSFRLWGKES
jgi:hypothetical protein